MADRPKRIGGVPSYRTGTTEILPPDQARAAAKALKEARIEEIASIMRRLCEPDGSLAWTTAKRKELGKKWGEPDFYLRKLSAIASKRVSKEVTDPDTLRISAGTVVQQGLAATLAKRDWKNAVQLAALAQKMAEGSTKVDVDVQVRQVRPSDAAAIVTEIFGANAAKPAETAPQGDAEGSREPSDSPPEGAAKD